MSGIRIHINDEVIQRFTSEGLSLDILGSAAFVLLAMYNEQFELLDAFDDRNTARRAMILYRTLYRKGFLELGEDDNLYNLTEKGVQLVNLLKSYDETTVRDSKESIRSSYDAERSSAEANPVDETTGGEDTKAAEGNKHAEVAEWIETWLRLFPSDKIQGRYLRTGKHECADRMRWFVKEYNYPKDVIFKATTAYLESQEMGPSGHTYTRNSSYFIFKGRSKYDRTSDLATWCQRVLDGDIEDKEYIERDAV